MTATEPSLGDLIDRWETEKFQHLSYSTQRAYAVSLKKLSKLRHYKVSALTRSVFYDEMRNEPTASQNAIVQRASALFSWAIEVGEIESAPRLPAPPAHKAEGYAPWTNKEIADFRETAREEAMIDPETRIAADGFELMLGTGQRISDVVAMRMEHFDGEVFKVVQQKTKNEIAFRPAGKLLELLSNGRKRGFVLDFETNHGSLMGARLSKFQYRFRLVREKAGIVKSPHGLRKTVAVRLRELGQSDEFIASLLGHKSGRMVALYGAAADRSAMASAAASAMDKISREI